MVKLVTFHFKASRARAVSDVLQRLRFGARPGKAHVRLPRAGCDRSRNQLVQFELKLKRNVYQLIIAIHL